MSVPISPEIPGEITDLGVLLGLVDDGRLNEDWFADPIGEMSGILHDPDRRQVLVDRAAELLGSTPDDLDLPEIDGEETWIPLVDAEAGPLTVGIFAIIDTRDAPVVALGARLALDRPGDGVVASVTVRVPLVAADGITLLPGTAAGAVEVAATIDVDGLGVPGVVELDGLALSAVIPTDGDSDPALTVVARGLLLPGDPAPADVALGEAIDELGVTAIQVFAALLAGQDEAPPAVRDLLALFGLDPEAVIPQLPIADLAVGGMPALRAWVAAVVDESLDAWLARLGTFLGGDGTPISPQGTGTQADPYRVCITDDGEVVVEACLSLVVEADGPSGSVAITPGGSIRVHASSGAGLPGFVDGTLTFARLVLDQGFTVADGPLLRATAQVGDGDLLTTTVDGTQVSLGGLRGGLRSTTSGDLVPTIEALDVDVAGTSYDVIDLTDADAVIAAASAGVVDILIAALPVSEVRAVEALVVLAGLSEPAGETGWPGTVDTAHLLSDPLGAIGCYHVEIIDAGRWDRLAAEVGVLLGAGNGSTPAIGGAGTARDPWSLVLFEDLTESVAGTVELLAWTVPADGATPPSLSIGLRSQPVFDAGTISAAAHYRAELLRVELPRAADCPAQVSLLWAPTHTVQLTIDEPTLTAAPITVAADRLELGLDLDRSGGLRPHLVAVATTVTIDGDLFSLGDIDLGDLGAIGGLGDLPAPDWDVLQRLLGDHLPRLPELPELEPPELPGGITLGDLIAELVALIGWSPAAPPPFTFPQLPDLDIALPDLPSLPALDLEALLTDPIAAVQQWLQTLLGSTAPPDGLPAVLVAIGRLAKVVAGEHLDVEATLDGRGTYEDPWAMCLAGAPLELLLWLDPDGPSLGGVAPIVEHLLPDDVLDSADTEALVALLERAAGLIPTIADRIGDAGELLAGVAALRALLEGDGIVTASSQAVAGWNTIELAPTAHHLEPAAVTLPQAVLDDIPPAGRIFVSSAALPGTAPWPGAPTLVDLSRPGIRPESIDLSHLTSGGPWEVRLPSRADAVVPTEPGVSGLDRLVARLRRAVEHIHGLVGGDLALIAHSTSGQVARLVAGEPAADTDIAHVVTVGTPHGGASFEHLDLPASGGALRTLQALAGMLDEATARAPDVAPLVDLLDTFAAALDPYIHDEHGVADFVGIPIEDFAVPAVYPDLGAGTAGHAIVGSVAPADLDAALAAFVRRVIEAGLDQLPAGGTVTHLGIGVRARLLEPSPAPGTIAVGGRARIDLHRFRLAPGDSPRVVPFASADLEIRRIDGWLIGGPDPTLPTASPRDPRARWLEASLRADPTALDDAEVQIIVHDASVFGTHHDRWVIDVASLDADQTLLPEVRVLLGETLRGLGIPTPDSALDRLAELLVSLGLAELVEGRIALVTDAVERFIIDPSGELRSAIAQFKVQVQASLQRLLSIDLGPLSVEIGTDTHRVTVSDQLAIELRVGRDITTCVTLELDRARLGGGFAVSGSVRLCVDGSLRADLLATSRDAPGPLGRVGVRLVADADDVTVHVESTFDGELEAPGPLRRPGLFDTHIPLFPPSVDQAEIALITLRALAGEIGRRMIEDLRAQLISTRRAALDAVLERLGLLVGGRLLNLGPLLAKPAEWLSAPGVLSPPEIPDGPWVPCLSRDGLAELLQGVAGVLDLPTAGGVLPLPWGAHVAVAAAGDGSGVHVVVGWDAPVTDGGITLDGSADLFVSCGLDVTAAVEATIEVTGTGLDHARLAVAAGPTTSVELSVLPTGGAEITLALFPTLAGLDTLDATAAAQSLLALVLDAVAGADGTPALSTLGDAVGGIGDTLGLRVDDGAGRTFDGAAIQAFAANPAAALLAAHIGEAFGDLAAVLQLLSFTVSTSAAPIPELACSPTAGISFALRQPSAGAELCVTLTDYEAIDGVQVDGEVCLVPDTPDPLRVRVEVEVVDPDLLRAAGISLFPRAAFYVGGTADAALDPVDRFEAGLWIDPPDTTPPIDDTGRHGLFVKVPFGQDANAVAVCRTAPSTDRENLDECLAAALSAWVTPLAAELLLAAEDVRTFLATGILDGSTTLRALLESAEILAPGEFHLDPGALGDLTDRIVGLAGGSIAAVAAEIGTIDLSPFTIDLVAADDGGRTTYALVLGLGDDLVLSSTGSIRLGLTAPVGADAAGAISLELFSLDGSLRDPRFEPALSITDVGLRVDHPSGGKLVDLIAGVDAIELLVDLDLGATGGDRSAAIELALENVTLPIGIAKGNNPVAAKVLSPSSEDNGAGDPEELAPALSPSLELALLPDPGVTFRLEAGPPPWWIPVQRRFGPVYVEQVGGDTTLRDDGSLEKIHILVDGEVSIAGLTVAVDDLALVIPVDDAARLDEWGIDLAGLAVGYSGSGVELAGGFRKDETPQGIEYVGMAQLDAYGYGLSAIGAYGEFTDPAAPGTTYTSMFVFAALDAPLGGPPFFFITGIGAGLGLNRELVLPDVDGIPGFPLVTAMSSGFASDPMGALEDISGSFPGRNGTFWFAAGIRFNSFVLLETVAVLSVEVGDDVEIALLGLSHAALPDASKPIANIELALIARFSTAEGVLWVQAQLTDNSWLLDRDCRLTGGFALVIWFDRGEFVFTVGGYHPRFDVPDHFPAVPRVGFNWTVDNALVIKGESYFALTSSAVMAGGSLEASYTTSTVWASLSAGVDVLVEWDPFFYDISAYVRVSAGIDVRICVIVCGRVRMSFSMGADIRIWGPKLQGKVTLELGPIDVTVKFGSGAKDEILTITWSEFVARFLDQGDALGESMGLAITRGLLIPDAGQTDDTDDGTAARPWRVVPEFTARFETRAASTGVDANGEAGTPPAGSDVPSTIDAAPTGQTNITSTFRVAVFDDDGDPVDGLEVEQFIISKLPDSPWVYVARESRAPAADYIEAFTGVTMRAALTVADDDIQVALDRITPSIVLHPIPFHSELLSRDQRRLQQLLRGGLRFLDEAQHVGTPAVYDAAREVVTGYSAASRATMTEDRVSPPRLAPLTEGMIDDVRDAVVQTPRPTPPDRPPRDRSTAPPIVMGVLRAPVSSQVRAPASTSVRAGADVPRVPAPSLTGERTGDDDVVRAHLTLSSTGVAQSGRTVVPRGHLPSTSTARRGREFRGGFRTDRETAGRLRLIERRVRNQGHTVAAGDVVVLRMPNARFDDRSRRPRLEISGDQVTRIVALDRAGVPVVELLTRHGEVELPAGVERIAVEGLGTAPTSVAGRSRSGLAGWHAQMLVHQVASNTYLARESIIRSAAPRTRRTGSPVSIANLTARDATFGRTVITSLPATTRVVLVGLAAVEPVTSLTDAFASVTMGLDGAVRRTTPGGSTIAPKVVVSGDHLYGVFAVSADPAIGRDDRRADRIRVTIESDHRWNVVAVGGSAGDADALLDELATGDPGAMFAAGPDPSGSSRLRFHAADAPGPGPGTDDTKRPPRRTGRRGARAR